MIPLLLISKNPARFEEYIDQFVKQHSVKPFYIFRIKPLKTEVTIDQIRAISREITRQAESMRVFICYNMETASIEAQNAFLKTLEEKHTSNQFILLSDNLGRILPTIRSRTMIVQLDNREDKSSIRKETVSLLNSVQKNSWSFFGNPLIAAPTREDALVVMDESITYYRDQLQKQDPAAYEVLKKIFHIKNLLLSNNLNPQLAIDSMLMFIAKIKT